MRPADAEEPRPDERARPPRGLEDIDGKTGLAIVGAIVGGQRDPSALSKLRDAACKKSEAEIAGHLVGTWREEHLFNLGQAYRTLLFIDERIAEYDAKAAAMFQGARRRLLRALRRPAARRGKDEARRGSATRRRSATSGGSWGSI